MIKLRRFSPADLKDVLGIEKISFPRKQVYSKSRFERYFQKCPESFIIAESKKRIAGYTIGKLEKRSAEIISLAVKPGLRQKGIGKKLTNFLISLFRKKGVKEIFLEVRTINKIAISLYRELGFKILKILRNYYRNGDDAYLMRKGI